VPLEDLRYLAIAFWGFDGQVRTGELMVHADVVDDMQAVFAALFAQRYPIRSMRLVDDFGADDDASIEADNTSAFNCRAVTGGSGWSQHAYGRAIDVNPIENPYVSSGSTSHAGSVTYLDRGNVRPGMITAGDAVVDAFAARGWSWGGYWSNPVDYQHFSASGG
jgi:poly-gamma-glutamate synthesis protein (capsule biosynthesis protein)